MRRVRRFLPWLIAAVVLLAACGDDTAAPDDEPASGEPTVAEDVTLAVAESPLGAHLVDGEGRTLYLFDDDEPGVSTCTGECLASWPPAVVDDQLVLGDGVEPDLVGTIDRDDDGSTQVTYDGQPLYRWAGDREPGDVEGQGVNDVWWVVAPDGAAITESPDDTSVDDGDGSY